VVAPITQLTFFRRQHQKRMGQAMSLRLRPPRFRLVQDGNIRNIVERQERPPSRSPHVERRGDDDATEPSGERGGLLEIAKAPERAQVGLLHRVLRGGRVFQHAERDGVRHRLRRLDESPVRLDVARLGSNHQISQSVH
jgi:hypothetical protein